MSVDSSTSGISSPQYFKIDKNAKKVVTAQNKKEADNIINVALYAIAREKEASGSSGLNAEQWMSLTAAYNNRNVNTSNVLKAIRAWRAKTGKRQAIPTNLKEIGDQIKVRGNELVSALKTIFSLHPEYNTLDNDKQQRLAQFVVTY